MKIIVTLLIASCLLLPSCKPDVPPPLTEREKQLIKIAGEDYQDYISLPISPDGTVDTNFMAKIEFEQETLNFDSIDAGAVIEHNFQFTNKGVKNLQILDARSSCGCTVPSYSEDPIAPGKTGFITVKYDTKDLFGLQEKIIRVYTNTYPNESLLKLKGFVISQSIKN